MSQWRVSFVFSPTIGNADTGGALAAWSETWYYNPDSTPFQVRTASQIWMAARRRLLTRGWRIQRYRVADWLSTRTAFSVNVLPADGNGSYPTIGGMGAGSRDEQPYDVLIMNSLCVSGKGKNFSIGGIGSDVVNAGGVFTPSANWLLNFDFGPASFSAILGSGWAVKRLNPTPRFAILGVSIAGGGATAINPVLTVSLPSNPLFNAVDGQTVRISGVIGMGGINGTWVAQTVVVNPANLTITLQQKRGVTVVGSYVGGGRIWWYQPILDPISSTAPLTPHRGSSRKRGGNPDRPRGRRSRRRL